MCNMVLRPFICRKTGMDAQVAYGFHHLRDEKPFLAQGPIANKVFFIIILKMTYIRKGIRIHPFVFILM